MKIPAELRKRNQWVLWKYVDGRKQPFQLSGQLAKSNDAATWASFDETLAAMDGYEGLGYVFGADDPFVGIDLDGCRFDGQTAEWAKAWIKWFDSYTEISPSGTGYKIWIRGKSPRSTGKNIKVDEPTVCDKDPGVEFYDRGRFFCVTGQRVAGVSRDIEERQEQIDEFADHYDKPFRIPTASEIGGNVVERARKYLERIEPAISGQGGHNVTFRAACALVLGFELSTDEAYGLLCDYNQRCQPPWTERELRHKVESAAQQGGERGYLRRKTVDEAVSYQMPDYSEPKEQEFVTLQQAAEQYLENLQHGSQLVDLGIADLDSALGGGVSPGEMVVIAARPSHGKSAIALQCLDTATRNGMNAMMISEEMSRLAIGKRAIQFACDVPEEHWRTSNIEVRRDLTEHFDTRAKCFIVESCRTPERVEQAVDMAVNEHNAKVVAVDYAQLLSGKGKTRYEQTTDTSVKLRQIASKYNIVLLVLAQLSRAIEGRVKNGESFLPKLSDLKDSGQFEQDADVIVMLVWPHRINMKNDPHEFKIFIGKNRNRAINCGAFTCRFLPSRQQFLHELPQRVEEAENYESAFDEWNNG